MMPQAAVQPITDATVLEESYRRTPTALGHLLEDLLKAVTALMALAAVALWWLTATPAVGSGSGSSSHRAGRRAGGGGNHGGRGHADNHVTSVSRVGYDARRRIKEIRCKKSSTAGENDGFPAFSARLRICCSQRNSSL
jgi:hypothetical protein